MQKSTILFLTNTEPFISHWVIFDSNGNIMPQTSLDEAKDSKVICLVPSEDVVLTFANLPKLTSSRLQLALPFALEEQLIDDVENLHFATGNYIENGTWPVAVVSKKKMSTWLETLNSLHITPAALTPLTFALPYLEENWHIFQDKGLSTVRIGERTGFGCDTQNLETLIDLKSAQPNYSNLSIQDLLEANHNLVTNVPINLLQNAYKPRQTTTQAKKIWQIGAILTCSWLFFMLLNPLSSLFVLQRENSVLESKITAIYKIYFPQASSLVNANQRMQGKLKTTLANQNQDNFLRLVSILTQNLVDKKAIQLKHLEFRDKQLSVEVETDSFDHLDSLISALTRQGLSVKRQNATTQSSIIKANLLITAGES